MDEGMRLDGMNHAVIADGMCPFHSGKSNVGSDVNHGIARFEKGTDEVHIGIPLMTVNPELPGKVGRMQMESK